MEKRGARHRVAIVGSGPAQRALQNQLPRASFLGTLTATSLSVAYASSDVFLYPSTTEGWGATCLEAQASGLPVVATTSPGIVDVVAHGESGILTAPKDITMMANGVIALLADRSMRWRMGQQAIRHAASFNWEASSELMLSAYHEVANPIEGAGDDVRAPPRWLDWAHMKLAGLASRQTQSFQV